MNLQCSQVLLITGGVDPDFNRISSTEVSLQNHLIKMCFERIGNIWRQTIVKRPKRPDYTTWTQQSQGCRKKNKKSFTTDTLTPTRLQSTLEVGASWSGKRLASFHHQDAACELHWLTMLSLSPVVPMVRVLIITTSLKSWAGILPPSLGSKPAILLWRDSTIQLLQYHLPS